MATIHVAGGGNLQAAINSASAGDVITLQAGATWVGNFILPIHAGSSYITIQSDGAIPASGVRATPGDGAGYAIIQASVGGSPAFATVDLAAYWRLLGLTFLFNPTGDNEIISFGNGDRFTQTSLAQIPHHLFVDRCYINATPTYNAQKRAIGLNSGLASVVNSYIAGVKHASFDNQTIAGFNGPGPFLIDNNFLEAASENIMFGGADAANESLMPSDITITNNHLTKDLAWRGMGWNVKNLLELKCARRVTIDRNTLDYSWGEAQSGYAVLFNVRTQDNTNPWATIEDVAFTNNIVIHAGSAIQLLGQEDRPGVVSGIMDRVLIQDNLFYDISAATWTGSGRFIQFNNGGNHITVDHNTCINLQGANSSALYFVGSVPFHSLVITNNIYNDTGLGVFGDQGYQLGKATLDAQAPGYVYTGNVQVGCPYPWLYPAGNFFPATPADVGFTNIGANDYSLTVASPYHNAATDGSDIGVRLSTPTPSGTWTPTVDPGSYVIGGAAARLLATRRESTTAGSYGVAGAAATLRAIRRASALAGSYGVVGADVTFVRSSGIPPPPPSQHYVEVALAGRYDITGAAAGLVSAPLKQPPIQYAATVPAGRYGVTGADVTFVRTVVPPPRKPHGNGKKKRLVPLPAPVVDFS